MTRPTASVIARGILQPLSTKHLLDPFAVKAYPRHSPLRMAWTAQSRLLELRARWLHKSVVNWMDLPGGIEIIPDRGAQLTDTAVTAGQMTLLKRALISMNSVDGDVAEVGCYRGVTTTELAAVTSKTIYAIDPFIGYGGSEQEFALFQRRIEGLSSIRHIRLTSGEAANGFDDSSLSFVFIDAVHDVSNSWFDFFSWSKKVSRGGLVALHDVDDHAGVGFTLKRVLRNGLPFSLWGYCPNLAILRKH